MTFIVDSDLNGANPQFTLTCISTGGPATTVTWTRDSDTITEGTDTALDDQMTAQYIHTLTVTGRLGGLYTCTVANGKPSEDTANFTVEGKDILLYNGLEAGVHACTKTVIHHISMMTQMLMSISNPFHEYYLVPYMVHNILMNVTSCFSSHKSEGSTGRSN